MEDQIRLAAFKWLDGQTKIHGEILPRKILESGFTYLDKRITVIGPQGIWKPREFEMIPISITTTPDGPYPDELKDNGLIKYKYMGKDPNHRVNIGLRHAMTKQIPLIYFYGLMPGRYFAVWPVFIVADNPGELCFTVAADDSHMIVREADTSRYIIQGETDIRRKYITSTVKIRLHQQTFRERVLKAYMEQCSLCRLRHVQLLDAAHIVPDSDEFGDPIINNGVSLCKIHHAAFDSNIIGITPDHVIDVREDILYETDGPMLKHGIQELLGQKMILPRKKEYWPDKDRLDIRYSQFRSAI